MKCTLTHLTALLLVPLAALPADTKLAPTKAPFRVLYSDDTTHTLVCVSPYHQGTTFELEAPATAEGRTPPFGPLMIEGAVDETAGTGIEVHMLQPGFGYVPWWKSKVYPFSEHAKFMQERFGSPMPKGGWAAYMATGGDMVGVFTKRRREKKLAPRVSLRVNDCHGHEMLPGPKERGTKPPGPHSRRCTSSIPSGGSAAMSANGATGIWTKPGRLRNQASEDLGNSRWGCQFNGRELAETPDRSEPYANPNPALLGGPEHHRAWPVAPGLPKDGANQIEVSLKEGSPAKIVFLDLPMP